MSTRESLREWASIYLKGIFMGAADTVPGVSGGTIALITGIYERLVSAIAALDPAVLGVVFQLHRADGRAALKRAFFEMDLPFLIVLAAGVFSAVIGLSRLLAISLEQFPGPMNAFFFGLIAASAIVLYGDVSLESPRRIIAAIGGIAVAFAVTGVTAGGTVPHFLPLIFVSGAVTSSAMLLPGISGAALLYVLGQYEFMIDSLHSFIDALIGAVGGTGLDAVVESGLTVGVFLAGVAIGLLTIARVVKWAFEADRVTTVTVLVSLMVGALRLPATEILDHTARWTPLSALGIAVPLVGGAVLILGLDRLTDDLEYVD
ncbi:MAG: DUF368 domain-containing protein [Halobacteriales archaeon]|nr:DUF368 domain-containing protein [Halobacteriales archaeon]